MDRHCILHALRISARKSHHDGNSAHRCHIEHQFIPLLQSRNRQCQSAELILDRKSTRLNSSHLVISYAVFCLKKKHNPHAHVYPPDYYGVSPHSALPSLAAATVRQHLASRVGNSDPSQSASAWHSLSSGMHDL